ncbi:hypothetical protein CGRA01v4_07895 [Colletotrichum graminicola]|uniref:NACHT domain-containing protein n=1 Tax=Colletotrichum graminicola (strain M1.001 / M2 / FGSC 10212) TaxID=645133 RepID=E3Q7P2_COLGM|nr:uncharacterized protein GLRG_02075 [Colletotrichum graminicola M1.001]EFQ26904.1 hypothetical protein GLRG_02075 [Colletotrichum graminicola M1.001]WDK16612.1 hypothetical protein CGRA01v4_07895 [Colletotrichum graminicola]
MTRLWQTDSAFSEALYELIPEHTKKKTPQFIQKILEGEVTNPDDVNVKLKEWQKLDSQRAQKLKPIFHAINDYDGIIGILCSADPYPSALIWGGLKAVVECFRRYYQVFDQLEGQLKSLTHHLKLLKQYEQLFSESEHMRDLLVASYKGIIRFWIRVEDHCMTPGFVRALKTVTSISVTKINEIIADITDTSKIIERLVPVIQEQRRRKERNETVVERQDVQDKLDELLRRASTKDNVERWSRVCEWIMGRDGCKVSDGIDRPYDQHVQTRIPKTGTWLLEDAQFRRWVEAGSEANILWLRGGAGVGKSTICSQIVDRLESLRPEATVAFHFFSFNEELSPTHVYRNIARRLFFSVYDNEGDEISEEVLELLRLDPTSLRALQRMVAVLVAESKSCFILLDGLDEELENSKKERWQNASAVLSFFINLASEPDSGLKLWCSSQDHRAIRQLSQSTHLWPPPAFGLPQKCLLATDFLDNL